MRPLLRVQDLCKSYAGPVLSAVDFDLCAGEVHALVGENGAGKSTLCRILAGLTEADSGSVTLDEEPFRPHSRKAAERAGLCMVLQELNLIPTLSVAENVFFDELPHRWGWVDYRRLHADTREALVRLGLPELAPTRRVGSLGIGQQQLVEIAAGLRRDCRVLILDEPTAALTGPEIELLFRQVAAFRDRGGAVIYISHRLEEVQQLADRVTVLRDGRVVATRPAAEVSPDELVRLMVGRDLPETIAAKPRQPGGVVLAVKELRSGDRVRGVTFEVRAGEILGFAGLMGAGRTETMRAVFGADQPDAGTIHLHGAAAPAKIRSPRDAVRAGIALVTEDRKSQGLLLPQPVRANLTLPSLGRFASRGGWIDDTREAAEARRWVDRLGIRCHSPEQPVVELSGGNQQKVVVGKWLGRDCEVLIFDEPTRGIDVGARFEIYRLLDDLARRGKAVIVVSSDLKELMAVSDRILVMSGGRIAGEFRRGDWSEDRILTAAFSAHLATATSNFLLQVQQEVAVPRLDRPSFHRSSHHTP